MEFEGNYEAKVYLQNISGQKVEYCSEGFILSGLSENIDRSIFKKTRKLKSGLKIYRDYNMTKYTSINGVITERIESVEI